MPAETTLQLAEELAALMDIARLAVEFAHRQMADMQRVGAVARTIARGDVPEADRASLAATLRQLAEHCGCVAEGHLGALLFAGTQQHRTGVEADDVEGVLLHYMRTTPVVTH